jgi:hypothetical protein
MARCATWRFTDVGDISRILPVGDDHEVWRPCRNRVDAHGDWCTECVNALLLCPEIEVRRALVEHPSLSLRSLQDLTTDPDYITQKRATERLQERTGTRS